ncbi:MAG: D-lyxose/D-mannose family sugar isomerase [Bacilli bacterium]|nr:D-lyxose/D-mannose family sugar isomerase [Bacilli bacterium]
MKRSEINAIIKEMESLCKKHGFVLPPFANWTPKEWEEKGHEYDEIRDVMLGWDITDFGFGDFNEWGFGLFTIRNGSQKRPDLYPKVYAEKILYMRDGMKAPFHFHWFKTEDIINRGGGTLQIKMYEDDGDGGFSSKDVLIHSDGRTYSVKAGSLITLKPGESITIMPHQYHEFHAVKGTGPILIGEVSRCNDDENDNRFYQELPRYPAIEEDEPPYRLLCNEYPKAAS